MEKNSIYEPTREIIEDRDFAGEEEIFLDQRQ